MSTPKDIHAGVVAWRVDHQSALGHGTIKGNWRDGCPSDDDVSEIEEFTPSAVIHYAYAAPQPQQIAEPAAFRPMSTAPRDATIVRLLVDFDDNPLDDTSDPVQTIGHNNFDHDGEDRWQFAGWCWSHDCYTEGKGTPLGWLPFAAKPPQIAEPASQWIGVNERLPVWVVRDDTPCFINGKEIPPTLFSETVLVALKGGGVRTDKLTTIEGKSEGWWHTYGERVAAWMLAPKPPTQMEPS